jgi:hypothetical protein
MAEAADSRDRNDDALVGWLHLSGLWCILVERQMTTGIVIVGDIGPRYATERCLAEQNYMIQALSTDGAKEPFHLRTRRSGCPAVSPGEASGPARIRFG